MNVYKFEVTRVGTHKVCETRISAPSDLADFLYGIGLDQKEQENLLVLFLNTKNKLRGYSVVTVGLIDQSLAHPREVFRPAIINGATQVILAHNHPSGDPTPSAKDIACTRELVAAGKLLGIPVADHVIVGDRRPAGGGNGWFSFRDQGMIDGE